MAESNSNWCVLASALAPSVLLALACGPQEHHLGSHLGPCLNDHDLKVPFTDTASDADSTGNTVRWSTHACVPVQVRAGDTHLVPLIREALAEYEQLKCSELCLIDELDTPIINFDPSALERRIIFHSLGESTLPDDKQTLATVTFSVKSGELLSAEVRVDQVSASALKPGAILHAFGETLGLSHPMDEALPSMMQKSDAAGASASMTEADVQSLCAMYGSPGLCGAEADGANARTD